MPRPALPAIELRLIVTPTVALLVMLTPMPELLRTVFSAKRCPEPVSATAVPPLSEILLLLITLPGPLTERPGPRLNEISLSRTMWFEPPALRETEVIRYLVKTLPMRLLLLPGLANSTALPSSGSGCVSAM